MLRRCSRNKEREYTNRIITVILDGWNSAIRRDKCASEPKRNTKLKAGGLGLNNFASLLSHSTL